MGFARERRLKKQAMTDHGSHLQRFAGAKNKSVDIMFIQRLKSANLRERQKERGEGERKEKTRESDRPCHSPFPIALLLWSDFKRPQSTSRVQEEPRKTATSGAPGVAQ